jgi:type I restriction enzyme S subunit
MSLPRYPEYKPSGVEWLGDVPTHWEVVPFYSVAKERVESNKGMVEDNLLSLSYGRIVQKDISLNDGLLPESFETYQIVRQGDLVFRLTDLQNDKRSLRTAIVKETGIITSAYLAAMPFNISPFYLNHLLRSYDMLKVFYSMGGGLRQSMKFSDVKRLPTLSPPIEEQQTIAAFLDRETGKIDALIAEQKRLVELLAEKRQAVISHAVTKGLNPNVPMKDSGIAWLGEVPAHWKVGKCGFYLSIFSGFAFPSAGFSDDESDTKLLRGINVGVSRLKWDETVYWERSSNDGLDSYEMHAGDIVIGMDRPLISEGIRVAKIKASDLPCLLLQRVASIKTEVLLNPDYFLGLLSSEMFVAHFLPDTTGVSVPHISPEQINNFVIPVPPIVEQRGIATFLDSETAKFDTLTVEANCAIALLQERRSALISAAVTGKIDVRETLNKERDTA